MDGKGVFERVKPGPVVSLGAVHAAIREALEASLRRGRNWHAVTVGVDGEPYVREQTSRCCSTAEYFGKAGELHPVTVWATRGDSSVADEDVEATIDAYDPGPDLLGGCDEGLRRHLEAMGFTVED